LIKFITLHHKDSSFCREVDLCDIPLSSISTRQFWIDNLLSTLKELSSDYSVKIEDPNPTNRYYLTSMSKDLSLTTEFFVEFSNRSKKVYIPKFVDKTQEEIELIEDEKLSVFNCINAYRNYIRRFMYKLYKMNSNIYKCENLNELFDSNSKKRILSSTDIDLLQEFIEINNHTLNFDNLMDSASFDNKTSKFIKDLKIGTSTIFHGPTRRIYVTPLPCFCGRPLNYASNTGYLVELNNRDFFYYEPGYCEFDLIVLFVNNKLSVFNIANYGTFLFLLASDKINIYDFEKLGFYPKYEVMDQEFKEKLLLHIGKTY